MLFKQASSHARNKLSLEQLKLGREKAVLRIEAMRKTGIFGEDVIALVKESLEDYDQRIKVKEAALTRKAKTAMLEQEQEFKLYLPG